ncbi:protein FAM8A1-like [Actinia tenebrosa]|uniref:Protein FAM8A1-like n=1 Tax=Actinia tenebrosa TaxID=6105 RepID=A0A6P8IJ90_ACTTE|nr:protein FAM8A1-like [Actinia tenebrosa]
MADHKEKEPNDNKPSVSPNMTSTTTQSTQSNPYVNDTTARNPNLLNNSLYSLSSWYYMQSYCQYYYASCYLYMYHYWQTLASQSPTQVTSSTGNHVPGNSEQYRVHAERFGQFQQVRIEGCEARVSTLQKRILAEVVDFFFLYLTKFLMFSIFYNDIEKYSQLQYSLIVDENTSLKDLEELLIQALVYRFMVFAYETLFIVGGFYGILGGATPGKYFVGILVLSAETVELIDIDDRGEKVRVVPGMNPGWWRASLRALVKNFSMTFLFPVFLTIFFFKHNRTIYDIISGTVVVDKESYRQRHQ